MATGRKVFFNRIFYRNFVFFCFVKISKQDYQNYEQKKNEKKPNLDLVRNFLKFNILYFQQQKTHIFLYTQSSILNQYITESVLLMYKVHLIHISSLVHILETNYYTLLILKNIHTTYSSILLVLSIFHH